MYEYTARPRLRGGSYHIIAQSWYDKQQGLQQHLTHGVLRDALWGLREFVHYEDMYMGLSFDVGNEILGKLGEGILRPGLLPQLANVSMSDVNVTAFASEGTNLLSPSVFNFSLAEEQRKIRSESNSNRFWALLWV